MVLVLEDMFKLTCGSYSLVYFQMLFEMIQFFFELVILGLRCFFKVKKE